MRLETVPLADAIGGILVHNVSDSNGHKAFPKGHLITAEDIERLRGLGKSEIYVGLLEAGDVRENEAAARIAQAVCGDNLSLTLPSGGRVNLMARVRGVFKVNDQALREINSLTGVALATIRSNTVVEPKKMVATVKMIGLAVPETTIASVVALAQAASSVLRVAELTAARVAVILSGSAEARERVLRTFSLPIRSRVQELGGTVESQEYVEHTSAAIAAALSRALDQGVDCIVLAGETSIMDSGDVTPTAIRQAGGALEVYGAPVEPGNLLLLAYAGSTPIVGTPGCVKSRDTNVIDLILPRLFSGERVTRADIAALGNGGLLI